MPIPFRILTLGCKLNRSDSLEAEAALRARGFAPAAAGEAPQVIVINTCTVTHRADADARQLLTRERRRHPKALVVATGCLAERDPGSLRSLPGVDLVLRRADRERIGARIASAAAARGAPAAPGAALPSGAGSAALADRTRAFLKIQEGCDLACAYCVIPQVRGPSRSVPPEAAAARLAALVASGYREIVLTGVNTGDYGGDLSPATDLAALLRRLLRTSGLGRLRLNSLEPRRVTPEIVALLAGEARLAPHLQVPLQSGSDRVLRAMRRNYRLADYASLLERLAARVPGIGLGADVLVGHPGEGEAEFDETERFLAGSPLAYLHVFSYSPRPGTASLDLPGRVPEARVRERAVRLREVGAALAARFRARFVGATLEVLGLRALRADGRIPALAGNFLELALEADESARNRLLRAAVLRAEAGELVARPAGGMAG